MSSNGLGDADTHAEQLERLLMVGALPNVSIGIVPNRLNRARMPVEGFWIFDTTQVNVELVSGHLTLTQPNEMGMYADTFTALAGMAVYGVKARALTHKAREVLA